MQLARLTDEVADTAGETGFVSGCGGAGAAGRNIAHDTSVRHAVGYGLRTGAGTTHTGPVIKPSLPLDYRNVHLGTL